MYAYMRMHALVHAILSEMLVIMVAINRRIKMFKIMHPRYKIMTYVNKSFQKSLLSLTFAKYAQGCCIYACCGIFRNPTLFHKL